MSFDNNLLTIGYLEGFGFHQQAVSKSDNNQFVNNLVSKYFNKNISVRFVMAGKKPQAKESNEETSKDVK